MPSGNTKRPSRQQGNSVPRQPLPRATEPPEVVDPRWLLKAAGAVVLLGLFCAYLTLCVFFYLGQWQFVLHPSRTVASTPASQQLAFESVRFGDDRSGQPQLTGWWIPGDDAAEPTVLLLHDGAGSMSDALPLTKTLHEARLNVFVFDYRGFGQSEGRHPTQALMRRDSESARDYLLTMRHVPADRLLVAGAGLGASLAVRLCTDHPDSPGLFLFDADGDTATRVEADQRSRILPVGLLFHERFPLSDPLHALRTPKLLVSYTRGQAPEIYQRAADPKITAELAPSSDSTAVLGLMRRFLDQYVGASAISPSATH